MKNHRIIKQISRRARVAFVAYERDVRPYQQELLKVIESETGNLGINIFVLTEILGLFEAIKNTQDQITNRAKNALLTYDQSKFQPELLKILKPQSDNLAAGLHGLIEVLGLFEEIKGVYDAAIGHAKEASISEEEFWEDFIASTTLSMNIGEIINTSPVMTAILSDISPDILRAALDDLPSKRKQLIRKALG